MTKDEWYDLIVECDGAEVPRHAWLLVEELAKEGKVTLGSHRGPNSDWRRAEPIEGDETSQ